MRDSICLPSRKKVNLRMPAPLASPSSRTAPVCCSPGGGTRCTDAAAPPPAAPEAAAAAAAAGEGALASSFAARSSARAASSAAVTAGASRLVATSGREPAAGTVSTYPITITALNALGSSTQKFTLTINPAPFTVGTSGSFTVRSLGAPTAALSETGTLPAGVTFTDNHNGTATIAGTPAAGTGGTYPFTLVSTDAAGKITQSFTLTVDQSVSGLAPGFGMVADDPAARGSGSVIAYNTVQEGVFARGVWLSGVQNVAVHDNYIQRTSSNGIFIQQLSANLTDAGPSTGITISNNLVDQAIAYANVSHGVTFAAASIYAVSQNSSNAQVTSSPHSQISVTGNRITNLARTAIRLENVNTGAIMTNAVQGFGLASSVTVFSPPSCCETWRNTKPISNKRCSHPVRSPSPFPATPTATRARS